MKFNASKLCAQTAIPTTARRGSPFFGRPAAITALTLLLSAGQLFATDLVLLGTHPTSPLTGLPRIHTLKAFEDRIYFGYGGWQGANFPALVVASFNPASNTFHLELSANTDSIGIFREIGGILYAPHIDPVLYSDSRDYSYRAGGVWRDSNPSGMLHVFDMATLDGSDLWLVGAKYPNETAQTGPAVFRSADGGRSWQDLTIQVPPPPNSFDARYYWGFSLRGRFYVRDTYYEGTNGTRTANAPYRYVNRATPMRDGTNEFIVGVTGWVPGAGGPVATLLVTYDTQTWRTLRPGNEIYHFTVRGSNIFTLETNASANANALWMASSVTPSQAVWQRLDFNNVPANAKAIEVLNDTIYVADTLGGLWAGRLDGSAITPAPPTVVNELADDFGRALSFDGQRLAVGAPDHSGSVPLSGQVTIWEQTGGSESAWMRTAILDPPQPSFSGWFGKNLVLKGELLAVIEAGRDLSTFDRGSSAQVHIYERVRQNWTWRTNLNHAYAQSVAIDSGWLAVGVGGTNNATSSLHLYAVVPDTNGVVITLRTNITIQPHIVLMSENFWRPTARVVLESNLCAFATVGDVGFLGGPGEVQIYQRSGDDVWELQQVVQSPPPVPAGLALPPDRFGFSITMQNGWLAVGAPRDDTVALQGGAVHLYARTNGPGGPSFVLRQSIPTPVVQPEAAFGTSVALTDSALLVGCPGAELNSPSPLFVQGWAVGDEGLWDAALNGTRRQGAVFMFRRQTNTWRQVAEVLRPTGSADEFGSTVAFGSNWLAASSRFSQATSNLAERVAVWRFGPAGGELSDLRPLNDGDFAMKAAGELGRTYHLQTATDLITRNWTNLVSFTLTFPTTNLLDTTKTTGPQKYYRLRSNTDTNSP